MAGLFAPFADNYIVIPIVMFAIGTMLLVVGIALAVRNSVVHHFEKR